MTTVTIYLLRETVSSAHEALASREPQTAGLREHTVVAGQTEGVLFVLPPQPRTPDWVQLLGAAADPTPLDLNQSSSALLALRTADRWFAVTFGQGGRHLLDPLSYERGFGLRVALNTVDPERLRSLEARRFGPHALHTHRQISRSATIEALEMNVQRDLLKAVTGEIMRPEVGKRIVGRDSVRLTAELNAADLTPKCEQLHAESKRKAYRKHFPWFDTTTEIRDPARIEELDQRVHAALGSCDLGDFDLYPPERVNDEIVLFELRPGPAGSRVLEPDERLLARIFKVSRSADDAAKLLGGLRLIGVDSNGDQVTEWALHDCLYCELSHNDGTYVLDGGTWYRVDRSFVNTVNAFANALKPSGLKWPDAPAGIEEGAYNALAGLEPHFAHMDQRLIALPGQSKIEACDLFSSSGYFVHVKRRKGGSAPLSHLFGQAAVSAQAFVSDREFRKQLVERLADSKPTFKTAITDPVDPRRYGIVLALITQKPAPTRPARELPFFSKVYLRLVVQQLESMQFPVFVDEIATSPGPTLVPPPAARKRARAKARQPIA